MTQSQKSKIMDKSKFFEGLDNDMDIVNAVVEAFIESHEQVLADINQAISEKNPKKLEHSAHTLKGSMKALYANQGIIMTEKLEQMGRSHTLEGAKQIFSQLQAYLPVLLEELQQLEKAA